MQAGLLGAAASVTGAVPRAAAAPRDADRRRAPLRILILGGTGFIGPHMVREALRRGHELTLFNRGRSNSDLFPDLELLIGDRDGRLDALEGGEWDAVIDNSGYVPRHVEDSARLLAGRASRYLFISSVSVYASFAAPNDEESPLATMPDETVEEVTGETYGPMKALCEQRAAEAFGADRLTVVRPTYICGPGDHTDRYTYWPVRTARGGDMLWPGTPEDPIQIIDVRDLAAFVIDCLERDVTGTYNAVSPAGAITMGGLLADCLAVTGADTRPVWVPAGFLADQDLVGELPIWSPPEGEGGRLAATSGERAAARGLRIRPPRETARDTLAWWRGLPAERTERLRAGPKPERETAVLDSWRAAAS